MTHPSLLLSLVFIGASVPWVTGLKCYTCVSTPSDSTCINDPAHVTSSRPVTDCDADCCTILRRELTEEKGVINEFQRGCQKDCPEDDVYPYPDPTFMTYLSYCSDPLCNSGPGDEDGGGGGGGRDDGNSIYGIKGKGGASAITMSLTALLPLTIMVSLNHNGMTQ